MPPSEPIPGTPRETLFHYFRELLALNEFAMAAAQSAATEGRDVDLDDLRARRAAIRARFCTQRPRKTDDVVAYGLLDQKAYDESNIKVEGQTQETKTRVRIDVYNSALREHWRYALITRDGRWLIDSLKFRDGRKWTSVPLH